MATILNKYWQIENQCHFVLNKDIIILVEPFLSYTLLHSWQKKYFGLFLYICFTSEKDPYFLATNKTLLIILMNKLNTTLKILLGWYDWFERNTSSKCEKHGFENMPVKNLKTAFISLKQYVLAIKVI